MSSSDSDSELSEPSYASSSDCWSAADVDYDSHSRVTNLCQFTSEYSFDELIKIMSTIQNLNNKEFKSFFIKFFDKLNKSDSKLFKKKFLRQMFEFGTVIIELE